MSAPATAEGVTRSAPDRVTKPAKTGAKPTLPEEILGDAQSGRAVVQDFCPLADSLEWQLGQQYLRDRGNKAFLADAMPVPFVINNDGTLSRNAAEVFFASLAAAENEGPLEDEIFVLELGIGVGLFARYFLDAFRDLSYKHGKDYYDRLCYIAADHSEQMLSDACRHGVFANHPGRYRLRVVDALRPHETLPRDNMFRRSGGRPLRAVFLNYVIDCLPAAVLEFDGDEVRQLCVRTCVARNIKLEEHTDLKVQTLAQRAKSLDPVARKELLEVYGLFASEYDYRPVDIKTIPHADFAVTFGRNWAKRVLHNYGAIQCLERLLELLHEHGFILINDYGMTTMVSADDFEHQRFSLTTAMGLNFPLLQGFFARSEKHRWAEPLAESESIHARLLGHQPHADTLARFKECFSKAARERLDEPVQKARECVRVGRFELAADLYREGLKRQPYNWVLLNEVAMFLIYSLRDLKAGIDLAKVALAQNPSCSSELWNTLGDGLFEFGRVAESRQAYLQALQLNETDVRARYNLAWAYAREKEYILALRAVADALVMDARGDYRERLLQKQAEILAAVQRQHQQEYLLLTNLVSKHAKDQDKEKPAGDSTAQTPAGAREP